VKGTQADDVCFIITAAEVRNAMIDLDCEEMGDGTDQRPIVSQSDWQQLVEAHSQPLFPREVWNKEWQVHGQSFIPLVRTYRQPLDVPTLTLSSRSEIPSATARGIGLIRCCGACDR
jgi:hypothetical protein